MNVNRDEIKQKIKDWFDLHSDEMIADLGRLIAVNSVRGQSEEGAPFGTGSRAVLSLAESMLKEHGFDVFVFEDMVITADLGPAPPVMGILAHLDIVAAGDGWDSDPFEMTVKDGKIYGRGATDNKGPSIAAMYALYCARDILPEMKNGVRVILGSAEETGLTDVAQYVKKITTPPNLFTPDATYPVTNVEKGRLAPVFSASWDKDTALPRIVSMTGGKTLNIVPDHAEAVIAGMEQSKAEDYCREFSAKTGVKMSVSQEDDMLKITAKGIATHAAMPEKGNNAQTALVEMLAAMPFAESKGFECIRALNRLFPHGDFLGKALGIEMSDEKSGKLTLNFGVMRFTEYEFAGNFDSRTPACADDMDLADIVHKALENEGITITSHTISQCHHTPEDSVFVQSLLRIFEEYTGEKGECLIMGGQTYVHGIKGGVAFGCGMPGVNNNVHGVNEFIEVSNLIDSAKMFTQVIADMCL